MRLFIALSMPEGVKTKLGKLQEPMEGVRWQLPSQMHLTLKFLGETKERRAQKLINQISNIEHPAVSLTVNRLGTFPPLKQPRVLWAGIRENDSLIALHEKIERLCTSLGFDPKSRSFTPHITLARMKGISKENIVSLINQHKQFQISDILIDQFVLYESKLDSEGATHYPLQSVKLTDYDHE